MINMTVDLGQVLFGLAALATAIFPILSWRASRRTERHGRETNTKIDAARVELKDVHDLTNSLATRESAAQRLIGFNEGEHSARDAETAKQGAAALAVKEDKEKA